MNFTQYAVVTYDDFYKYMSKSTGVSREQLFEALSYNDSFFEDGVTQFIEEEHDFSEAMEQSNLHIALAMNKALDTFFKESQQGCFLLY